MFAKITSKRQVTFPKEVLDEMGLKPGDTIRFESTERGYLVHPSRFDWDGLEKCRAKVDPNTPPFDLQKFRETPYDPSLRD